ncbi:MAG: hypothetical protein H7Z74_01750 [Anaerolineae bacterium]|nr:hypothetical protein [Gemmatimonadaceae bacterium]
MKIAIAVLSAINLTAGIGLIGAWITLPSSDIPVIVLFTGLALAVQGGFTLLYLSRPAASWRALAARLMIAGETAAIAAGGLAALTGFLYNLKPRNGDFEFGPMSLGVLMAMQAVAALIYIRSRGELEGG